MTPELETLDQLLGGDMALTTIRGLYPHDDACRDGILGLLRGGDVQLLGPDNLEIPRWRWPALFANDKAWSGLVLRLTEQGLARIA